MAFVLDASIAVAWVVPSQATQYAARLRLRAKREAYHVPSIFAAEVTNVLVTLERRGILSARGADAGRRPPAQGRALARGREARLII